jgi:hypothetical protein
MRVHMLRTAIFWPVRVSNQRIRVAPGLAGGTRLTCVLLGRPNAPTTATRLWSEQEYCIDSAGLPRVYSPALGAYTYFEYSAPLRFGGRTVPNRIRTFIGGNQVLDARLRIGDAGTPDDRLFTPTPDMLASGPGILLGVAPPTTLHSGASVDGPAQLVVVHVEIDSMGTVLEAEVAHGDPALAPAALALVKEHRFRSAKTQRNTFVGVEFGSTVRTTP